jgi:hypothetical protein
LCYLWNLLEHVRRKARNVVQAARAGSPQELNRDNVRLAVLKLAAV